MTDADGPAPWRPGAPVVRLPKDERRIDWTRLFFLLLGVGLFAAVYFSPAWPSAADPGYAAGHELHEVVLSRQGQLGLGLFLLAAVWWVFEVVPIGVTSILIVTVQSLFLIRDDPKIAFMNCLDPSVWFIFGSLMIGLVFTKTGLTRRIAYRMLAIVGERTSMVYLGTFVLTAALTLVMAHTAVAATLFPLLMAIYALYDEDGGISKFGKGLFMGMAYVAGAGSIITLLGAARGAVAIGFFRTIADKEIGFFELSYYMLPVGVLMTILLWVYFMIVYKPERDRIPGLREKAKDLYQRLGPITRSELGALFIVFMVIALLSIRALSPPDSALGQLHKSAVILSSTILFFVFRILSIEDLEKIPWNIILLFGGAMSIGFCLWETGAARWLALHWLVIFHDAPWLVFVLGVSFFVLIMTNFIMNVAAIAISLPVALLLAPYLGVAGEVVLYASLATAGMPFLCLVGAAPNAIAYESGQFTSMEFFKVGIPASVLLMGVLALFIYFIWPLMGMPVLVAPS